MGCRVLVTRARSARWPPPQPISALMPVILLTLLGAAAAVKGPPVLSQRVSPHLVVRLGDNVRLSCPVTGTPQPMIEWRKDGATVRDTWERFSLAGSTLRVERVTSDDTGVYVCSAVNGFGTKKVTTELFVIDQTVSQLYESLPAGRDTADNLMTSRGRAPSVLLPEGDAVSRVDGQLGARILLNCVTSGYPQPEIRWYKKGRPVVASARVHVSGGQLVFSRLLGSDQGLYLCVAQNVFGTANHSFAVTARQAPRPGPAFRVAPTNSSVLEGETAVLDCHVHSAAATHITWMRRLPASATPAELNATLLTMDGARYAVLPATLSVLAAAGGRQRSRLTLPAVSPRQQGVYVCMATVGSALVGREALLTVLPARRDSLRAVVIAAPLAAVLLCVLGAICCLHRRRTAPPPGDAKHTPAADGGAAAAAPAPAHTHCLVQQCGGAGAAAAGRPHSLRTVLVSPSLDSRLSCGRHSSSCERAAGCQLYSGSCSSGTASSRTRSAAAAGAQPPPPPPAPYDHRLYRQLDVV